RSFQEVVHRARGNSDHLGACVVEILLVSQTTRILSLPSSTVAVSPRTCGHHRLRSTQWVNRWRSRGECLFNWQRKMKRCAASGVGGSQNAPAMRLNNGTGNHQSETCTTCLCGEERVENFIQALNWQADSGIANGNEQFAIRNRFRFYCELTAWTLHCLN